MVDAVQNFTAKRRAKAGFSATAQRPRLFHVKHPHATHRSCTACPRLVHPTKKPSARRLFREPSDASAERALQLGPARCELLGQSVPEQLQELIVELQLALPLRAIDRADALVFVSAEGFEPLPLQVGEGRNVADRSLDAARFALAALDDPLQ